MPAVHISGSYSVIHAPWLCELSASRKLKASKQKARAVRDVLLAFIFVEAVRQEALALHSTHERCAVRVRQDSPRTRNRGSP